MASRIARISAICLVLLTPALPGARAGDTLWELEAVNPDGTGAHPKVGADPVAENRVVVEGISLSTTGEIDRPGGESGFRWYSIWLQDPGTSGGLQAWAGSPWYASWRPLDRYPDVRAGDWVRIEGWVANHNGKVFINDRHTEALAWRATVLGHVGMPNAEVIPDIASCNYFDQTRSGGGEKYQTRWTRLDNVEIVSGNWAPGEDLVITDDSGATLTLRLSAKGDFTTRPAGRFSVTGIFDQEDPDLPYHEHYRLWVSKQKFVTDPAASSIWPLEAVGEDGSGSHPLVGADPVAENLVTVEGIALNSTGELLDPNIMYTIMLQDETGGLQAWAGSWWYADWRPLDRYPDIRAGDRVRITGWLANHNGKVFINDRHSAALAWTATVVGHEGMPDPKVIPSIAACNYFDPTRRGGGEKYQTQWVRLNGLRIVSGNWANGEELVVTDDSGATITMLLSGQGDFDGATPPPGRFDVLAIFDQEDPDPPYHEHYRLWVKQYSDIIMSLGVPRWGLYE